MDIFIYVLIDPITAQPRYVEQTNNPEQCIKFHYKASSTDEMHDWKKTLGSLNLEMKILSVVSADAAMEEESYWISFLRKEGAKLLNRRMPQNIVRKRCRSAMTE